jgi:hypothetical protein
MPFFRDVKVLSTIYPRNRWIGSGSVTSHKTRKLAAAKSVQDCRAVSPVATSGIQDREAISGIQDQGAITGAEAIVGSVYDSLTRLL